MGWIPGVDHAHQAAYDQQLRPHPHLLPDRLRRRLPLRRAHHRQARHQNGLRPRHPHLGTVPPSATRSSPRVAGFCIARIFLGLGESGNFPAAIKATTEWFPSEERAMATGLFNSGTNASFFIAPILIAAVTAALGLARRLHPTGSMGLVWLVIWLIFPYNKLRRAATQTQVDSRPRHPGRAALLHSSPPSRTSGPSASEKALTDRIWWFYLFYLPKFLNDNYGLDLNHVKYPLIVIYTAATVGSIAGGWLSGFRMKHGHSVNSGRKFALLVCAVCVLAASCLSRTCTLSFPPTPGQPSRSSV